MPLLPEENYAHPEHILDESCSLTSPWWVLYTLPRQEKLLCRHLKLRELAFYCPVVEREYRSPNGRRRRSYLPLFPNYVFLRGEDEARVEALTTRCVSQTLPVADSPSFLAELRQFQRIISKKISLTVENNPPQGEWVRLTDGPLAGIEGQLHSEEGHLKFFVILNLIRFGASIDLQEYKWEPLGPC